MRKAFNFSKTIFWVGLIFILYMFAILTNETGKNYQLRSKSDELEQEIAQMQSQIEELGYKITYYRTESYQDRLAREELGLQKPGESVVIVKKENNQSVEVPAENIKLQDKDEYEMSKSHWQQWREFLFGS